MAADPFEMATAFHRDLDHAAAGAKSIGSVSSIEHVNRVKYTRPGVPNRIGLGTSDNARRLANKLKNPTGQQIANATRTAHNKGPLGF